MKKRNILSGVLASALLITSLVTSMPVFAAGEMTTGDSTQANTNVKYEREASQIVVSIPAEVTLNNYDKSSPHNGIAYRSNMNWYNRYIDIPNLSSSGLYIDGSPYQFYTLGLVPNKGDGMFCAGNNADECAAILANFYESIDTISVSQAPDDTSKKLEITIADTSYTLTGTKGNLTGYAEFPSIDSSKVSVNYENNVLDTCSIQGTTSEVKIPVTFFYYGDVTPDTYTGTVTFNMEIK